MLLVYLFVVIVDPWGSLPLSPPLPRVPISTNARYAFPALARAPRFDAAIVGTSTSRLLRPDTLDPLLHARFVNLSMNSATAWEQARLLDVFSRAHPHAKAVIIGLDANWCVPTPAYEHTSRPFPEWMYRPSRWSGYRQMANLYAVQEAANQFAVMLGLKRRRYGMDGYTNFLPDDRLYDPVRVAALFRQWGPASDAPDTGGAWQFPVQAMLVHALAALPPDTRKILFFVPEEIHQQGKPGSRVQAQWAACKKSIAGIATGAPGTTVIDFMIQSPITQDRNHYWDPLHYRITIADTIMRDMAAAEAGLPAANKEYRLLP